MQQKQCKHYLRSDNIYQTICDRAILSARTNPVSENADGIRPFFASADGPAARRLPCLTDGRARLTASTDRPGAAGRAHKVSTNAHGAKASLDGAKASSNGAKASSNGAKASSDGAKASSDGA